jgi:hypothetical protein
MVVVALVGSLVGLEVELEGRRARFNDVAEMHRRVSVGFPEFGISDPYPKGHPEGRDAHNQRSQKFIRYHKSMENKYNFAASYPWFPVLPDPPEPGRIASPDERRIWSDYMRNRRDPIAELPFRLVTPYPPKPE